MTFIMFSAMETLLEGLRCGGVPISVPTLLKKDEHLRLHLLVSFSQNQTQNRHSGYMMEIFLFYYRS